MLLLLYFYGDGPIANNYNNLYFLLLRLITFLILFLIIIGIAYLTTKFLGGKGRNLLDKKNLKIIEKISLGLDKSLFLINLENQYYVITVTKNNIQLIDKLNKDNVNIVETHYLKDTGNSLFKDYLDKFKNKSSKEITKNETSNINLAKALKDIRKIKDEFKEVQEANKDESK